MPCDRTEGGASVIESKLFGDGTVDSHSVFEVFPFLRVLELGVNAVGEIAVPFVQERSGILSFKLPSRHLG